MAEILDLSVLKEQLRSGQLSTYQYLELIRQGYCIGDKGNYSPEKGITRMMHRYCEKHGLKDIPDLDVVWKKPEWHSVFKVNNRGKDERRTGKETTGLGFIKG